MFQFETKILRIPKNQESENLQYEFSELIVGIFVRITSGFTDIPL